LVDNTREALERQVARLGPIRATARSSDGLVEVTVDVNGIPIEIRLGPPASRVHPDTLAAEIVEIAREATELATVEAGRRLAETDRMVGLPGQIPTDQDGFQ
jgi:hypothetical protein